jgi:hypothetical protein
VQIDQVVRFIVENREVLVAFIVSLIAIIKLTAWGKAQAKALDAVVGVVERVGAGEVKSGVANQQLRLSPAASDAIKDSVAKADPKQSPLSIGWKIVREIFRGI